MTRTTFTAVASALLISCLSAPLEAQVPGSRLVRLGFGGGVSVPTSDAESALENGINGQAYVLVDTGILPPLRFNLGYQKFDWKEAVLGSATDGQTSILSGVGGLSINLLSLGPLRPYVTAGLGAFHVSEELEGGTAPGEESSMRFGIDGGAGLALQLGRLEGFIEGRVQNVYTEAGVIDAKSIKSIPVTFGLLF